MAKKKVSEGESIRVLTISEIEKVVRNTVGHDNFQELCLWSFEIAYQEAPYQNIPRAGKRFHNLARKERDNMLLEIYKKIQAGSLPEGARIKKPDSEKIKQTLREAYSRMANPLTKEYRDAT